MRKKTTEKAAKKANISVTTVMFLATFIVFCAFAVDSSFIVLGRFKLQKAAEVTALACAANHIEDHEDAAKIFASNSLKNSAIEQGTYLYSASGSANEDFKVKLSTVMFVETHFLRFVGISFVRVRANAAAEAYSYKLQGQNFGETIPLDPVVTSKFGQVDFKIQSPPGYYVFAGIDNNSGDIVWEDMGCKAVKAVPAAEFPPTDRTVGMYDFKFLCSKETDFELSNPCPDKTEDSIGIVKYLKVFREPNVCALVPDNEDLNITVFNNTRLIRASDF